MLCHVCVLTGAVFLHICQLLSSFLFQGWPLERNRSQFTPHTVLNNLGKSKHYFASWVFCQVSLLPVTPRFCYSWFLSFPQGRAFKNSAGLWCFWVDFFREAHKIQWLCRAVWNCRDHWETFIEENCSCYLFFSKKAMVCLCLSSVFFFFFFSHVVCFLMIP